MRANIVIVLVISCLLGVMFIPMVVSAQSEPDPVSSWPTLAQNFQRTGLSPNNVSLDRGRVMWTFHVGFRSGITIGPDKELYGHTTHNGLSNRYYNYLDRIEGNGTLAPSDWQNWEVPSNIANPPSFGDDDAFYFSYQMYSEGRLASYFTNGSLRWRLTTEPTNSACAIAEDGTIYFGTYSSARDKGFLYAVYPNGSVRWRLDVGSCDWDHPTLGHDGTIYILSGAAGIIPFNNFLTAVNPNGTLKWRISLNSYPGYPVVANDGKVIVSGLAITNGSERSVLTAVNPDGTFAWHSMIGPRISCPGLDGSGNVYVFTWGGDLVSYSSDGAERWTIKYSDFGMWVGAPAVSQNGVVLVCGRENIYDFFGRYVRSESYVYAYNQNHYMLWKCQVPYGLMNNLIVADDGVIFVVTDDGPVAIADDTDAEWNLPAVVMASGLFILLSMMPRGRVRFWALIPALFILFTIVKPNDTASNLFYAVFIPIFCVLIFWLYSKWTHET